MSIKNFLQLSQDIGKLLDTKVNFMESEKEDILNAEWQLGYNEVEFGIITKDGSFVAGPSFSKEVAEHIIKVHNDSRKSKTRRRSTSRPKSKKR